MREVELGALHLERGVHARASHPRRAALLVRVVQVAELVVLRSHAGAAAVGARLVALRVLRRPRFGRVVVAAVTP